MIHTFNFLNMFHLWLNCLYIFTKRFTILQGLKTGDQIVRFGSITGENSQGLHDIASVVQHSKGVKIQNIQVNNLFSFIILRYKLVFNPLILHIFIFALYQSPLSIIVEREGRRHTLSLTPNTWSGRGLLGYACLVILFIYLFIFALTARISYGIHCECSFLTLELNISRITLVLHSCNLKALEVLTLQLFCNPF